MMTDIRIRKVKFWKERLEQILLLVPKLILLLIRDCWDLM